MGSLSSKPCKGRLIITPESLSRRSGGMLPLKTPMRRYGRHLIQVKKEYEAEKEKLDEVKKQSHRSETTQLHAKIKNLEANL